MKHKESEIQRSCVKWFRLQYRDLSKLLFAIPNGGYRNAREAARMKLEGTTPGVSDLILLVSNDEWSSLCIEIKAAKGRQSEYQKQWQISAENSGNKYVICRSFDEFKKEIEEYLK